MMRFRPFLGGLLAIGLVGAALRLNQIGDQVLVDDEWHGMIFVLTRRLPETWLDFNPLVNSSRPYNVYRWLLLHTVGWSEIGLRLPVLLCGVTSAPLVGGLVRKYVGERAALICAFLIAISPILVFYSRFCRSYALIALLGPISIIALCEWLTTNRVRWAITYVLATVSLAYCHLTGLAVAGATLTFAVAAWTLTRWRRSRGIAVSALSLGIVVGTIALMLGVLLYPVFKGRALMPTRGGQIEYTTFSEFFLMLSGTGILVVAGLFCVGVCLGAILLLRRAPLFGSVCIVATLSSLSLAVVARPYQVEHGLVLLRYMMAVVPVMFLYVAVSVESLLGWSERSSRSIREAPRWVRWAGAIVLGLVLIALGPWRDVYGRPNSFSNHAAFQGSYARLAWDQSEDRHIVPGYRIRAEQVPEFYRWLGREEGNAGIIEYPFDASNSNNLLWYYQYFHRRAVKVGYSTVSRPLTRRMVPEDYVLMAVPLDSIISAVPAGGKLDFANMIDVLDERQVARSGAAFLVLHKRLHTLVQTPSGPVTKPVYTSIDFIRRRYQNRWGPPFYEDGELVVFRISRRED